MKSAKNSFKAAAGNWESAKEVVTLLLDRRGADVQITEDVAILIARKFNKEVMALLLDRRGADVQITEDVVKAAAGNLESAKEVVTLLLDRRGADVQITEDVVKATATKKGNGEEVITFLLDQRGADVKITKGVAFVAATSGQEGVLKLIYKRLEWFPHYKVELSSIAGFFNAAKDGEEEMIRELLVKGTKPDYKNLRNESPLWIAAAYGNLPVVKILLETKRVDINSMSISG